MPFVASVTWIAVSFPPFPDSRSIEPFRPDSLPFLLLLSPHRPRSAQWRRGGNISFIADIIPPDKKKKTSVRPNRALIRIAET